jgi:hypothetical protein
MGRRTAPPPRDQAPSPFARILQALLEAAPGGLGAALVDHEGECVDYAGTIEPFDVKIAAAHLQLELRKASDRLAPATGAVRALLVQGVRRSYVVRNLAEGYCLAVVLGRRAAFSVSERALAQAERELCAEAGWEPPQVPERWARALVETRPGDRRYPLRMRIGEGWAEVLVLGTVVGLRPGERGWRVRTASGAEMTLVRERLGRWYADVPVG